MPLTDQTRVLHRFVQVTAEHLFGSELPDGLPAFQITSTTDPRFGHFACNLAMQLAKPLKKNPRQIGEELADSLKYTLEGTVERIEVAGPGFLNFHLSASALDEPVKVILGEGEPFQWKADKPLRINLEYVSANPTGPLLVVNGRAAALGSALANILASVGHSVTEEYLVNDAGTQVIEFGKSVLKENLPSYIDAGWIVTDEMKEWINSGSYHKTTVGAVAEVMREAVMRETMAVEVCNKQLDWEEVIERISGAVGRQYFLQQGTMRRFIKVDLFRNYNYILFREHKLYCSDYRAVLRWLIFPEEKPISLFEGNKINLTNQIIEKKTYHKDDAIWLRTTEYGDEKDRVIVRSSGKPTYLLTDIAYHLDKWERLGRDESERLMIDIWGPDHHGHILPTKAGLLAAGLPEDALEVLISGWVTLKKGGETVSMSKRKGNIVTLDELLDEVGVDVARYMFLERSPEAHLDFDLDLAVQQSSENPAYYIQYAHARIESIFAKAEEEGYSKEELSPAGLARVDLTPLFTEDDAGVRQRELLRQIIYYPGVIESAAKNYAPQKVAAYLHSLAGVFHPYYKKVKVLMDDKMTALARLALCRALQRVIHHGLEQLLGINAPESM